MQILGKNASLSQWTRHYESMLKSPSGVSGPGFNNRLRGQINTFHVEQTGGGISTPAVNIISPTEANILQAKKILESRKSRKRKISVTPLKKEKGKKTKQKYKYKK